MRQVMLVGNPNCGKTTLFNALTGEMQRVGNWPGVTVEKKTGAMALVSQSFQITDLPGIYSLSLPLGQGAVDEQITASAVMANTVDLVVNVVDACHLERHLYLTSQLLELQKPMIVVLNMMDIAKQRGIAIDIPALSARLSCPVVAIQAHRQLGLDELKAVFQQAFIPTKPLFWRLPNAAQEKLIAMEADFLRQGYPPALSHYIACRQLESEQNADEEFDIILADARYHAVHQAVKSVQSKPSDASEHLTAKIDRIVLHRFLGIPIFLFMMYLLFWFAMHVGGVFQDFFDLSSTAIFVQGAAELLQSMHAPQWLVALMAFGIGKGINTTLTFIPVMAAMYVFLALLEGSGYMVRAAFVVDKFMRALGLPGKSFVPMIVGFGCNVPGILATRSLDSERDRLLTILMSPFMSCSARLAIYAVFVAAFFPGFGQNIVFSLYLVGIGIAVLTGFLLRKTLFKGHAAPLILELPAYHWPSSKRLWKETSHRLRYFIIRAGKLIVPICMILGGLNALTLHAGISMQDASHDSLLSWIGQKLTPFFAPMGITEDNWPATVGLLTGMLAKEVVIGSLNTLYAQLGALNPAAGVPLDVLTLLQHAVLSVPQHLSELGQAFLHPWSDAINVNAMVPSVYGEMVKRFQSGAAAYAYLLFVLLYIPCVSTMAVIRQEANRTLMWFSIVWSLLVAYSAAVLFYQCVSIIIHPAQTLIWFAVISVVLYLFILLTHAMSTRARSDHAVAST